MYGFMFYCICSVTHLRVRLWYLILSVASSELYLLCDSPSSEIVVLDPVSGRVGLDPRD